MLLQDHEKVLSLLNQLLSSVASSPPSPQSPRDRLHQLAVVLAERYRGCGHSAPQALAHTFFLLLDIMTFFDHYHNKREDQALEVNKSLSCLLPTRLLYVCTHAELPAALFGHSQAF